MSDFYLHPDDKPSGNCIHEGCGKKAVAVLQCKIKPISMEVCEDHYEYFLGASLTPDGEGISVQTFSDPDKALN